MRFSYLFMIRGHYANELIIIIITFLSLSLIF